MQLVNVCINGGECQDTGGTAECQCPVGEYQLMVSGHTFKGSNFANFSFAALPKMGSTLKGLLHCFFTFSRNTPN